VKTALISPSVVGTGILPSSSLYDYVMDMGKGSGSPWHLHAESLQPT